MAEVNVKLRNGKVRPSLKVDLTAMVDLGFLLITFFMLATQLTSPKTMEVNKMTDSVDDPPVYPASKTLNILLGEGNKIYYYTSASEGFDQIKIDSTNFGKNGLRKVILDKQEAVMAKYGRDKKDDLLVLIKPLPKSVLKNTVDALDEMSISGIKRFSIVEASYESDDFVLGRLGINK